MNRRDLILKNQEEFSELRRWAMSRQYVSKKGDPKPMLGVIAGAISAPAGAMANPAFGANAQLGSAVVFAGVSTAVAMSQKASAIIERSYVQQKVVQAFIRLGDRAKMAFRRIADGMFRVPADITKTRELSEGIAKIKFHRNTMLGVAQTSKEKFNPDTNIYLPVSQMEKDSPLYAKNKEIYNEIVEMAKQGVLSLDELEAIDQYSKGVTSFSSGVSKYDKSVNYSVALTKLEEIFDKNANIQIDRESLKVDDAKVIERLQAKEDKSKIVKPTDLLENGTVEACEALSDEIAKAIEETAAQAPFLVNDSVSVIKGGEKGTVVGYDPGGIVKVEFENGSKCVYAQSELVNMTRGIETFVRENKPAGGTLKDAAEAVTSKSTQPTLTK